MIDFSNKKVIFWDFDGVIIDSEKVRNKGFEITLQNYSPEDVRKLLEYHKENGGLSRYVKYRYFFEEILGAKAQDEQIQELSEKFSHIMREELTNKNLLIQQTLNFIKKHQAEFSMYIVSGSDEKELNYLCENLEIDQFFEKIKGSPTPKIKLVEGILEADKLNADHCILIGDSINDYDAARLNEVEFYAFNNVSLKGKGKGYIHSFEEIN